MKKIEETKKWETIVECKAGFMKDQIPCGCKYRITEKDLMVKTVNVMGECDLETIVFRCPECGSYTELRFDEVPEVVKNRVLGKFYAKKKAAEQGGGFKSWLNRAFG